MSHTLKMQTDRRLGWLAAGMLFFLLSSSAWASDLDQAVMQKDADSAQILQTLSRAQMTNSHTSKDTKKKVHVTLFSRKKKFKYAHHQGHKKTVRVARLPAHTAKKSS